MGDNTFEGKPKSNCVRNSITVAIIATIVIAFSLVLGLKKSPLAPNYYFSEEYEVVHDNATNMITLNPKAGTPHEYTVIFMHGYTMSSDMMFEGWPTSAMQGFGHGKIVPNNTRVIMPQAPVIFNPLSKDGKGEVTTSWFPFL